MPADLPIRCDCGAVRAIARGVSTGRGNRVVCYCDDCQSFAHYLGRADRILDPHGGTEVFQTSAARIELRAGIDRLACVRLRPGGLLRWYAECCRTPISNTIASRQLPFVGLIGRHADAESDRRARDQALGPVRARIQTRFAVGDRAALAAGDRTHDRVPASLLLRLFWLMLAARLRGDHARSPFFSAIGAPIAPPRVLSAQELLAVAPRG